MDFFTNQRNAVTEKYQFVNITITLSHYLLHLWWSYYKVLKLSLYLKSFQLPGKKAKLLVFLQGLSIQKNWNTYCILVFSSYSYSEFDEGANS